MFLRPTILNRLMKKAYKGAGLAVAKKDGWMYIAGRSWEVNIKEEFIPNQTKGDLLALTGEFPDEEERFLAQRSGNQYEFGKRMEVEPFNYDALPLMISNVILLGTEGTQQRLLQDANDGRVYAINDVFFDIVSGALIDDANGESSPYGPIMHEYAGVSWQNNVCRLRCDFRYDEKSRAVLDRLQGINLYENEK